MRHDVFDTKKTHAPSQTRCSQHMLQKEALGWESDVEHRRRLDLGFLRNSVSEEKRAEK
jgi:hypothetical protein